MNSGLCGKTVKITNTANGKTITARVADTCVSPSCRSSLAPQLTLPPLCRCPGCGYGSLDLSEGAFGALGSYSSGVLPIAWDLY